MDGGMSVTVVYVDSVFLLNALMDYFLLLAAGRLAGIAPHRLRYVLAAVLGGTYAVAVFLPGGGFLASPMVKLAAGSLVGLVAYGGEPRLLRMLLLFLGVSCGMAGAVLTVGLLAGGGVPMMSGIFYTDVSFRVLLIAATAAYVVLTVVFRASAKHGVQGELLPVKICILGKVQDLTALWDTGNGLRDPVGGESVLVVAGGSIREILPKGLRFLLGSEQLSHPSEMMELLCCAAPELHPRLLPYRAVGVRSGLLLTIRTDWIEVAGQRYPHGLIGLAPTELGTGYSALWGGEGKRGRHEKLADHMAAAPGSTGTASGRWNPLYWRQRSPASTTGQIPGSGAPVQTGSGGGQEGTHRAQSSTCGVHR